MREMKNNDKRDNFMKDNYFIGSRDLTEVQHHNPSGARRAKNASHEPCRVGPSVLAFLFFWFVAVGAGDQPFEELPVSWWP